MSSFPISITWQVASPPTASFDQLAKSAQSLDQAMMGTASNFDKFGNSVSQMESPLSGVSGSMSQLEGSMSGLDSSLSSSAGNMESFAGSTESLNGAISETGGFITDASGSMTELSSSTTETGGAMTELSGTTGEFNGAISETGGFVTETGGAMTEMGGAATETGTAVTDFGTATTDTNVALTESVDALGNVVPGLEDTGKGAEESAAGFEALKPPIEDTNTALDASSGLLEGVSPLLADTGINAGDAGTATGEFSGALGNLNTELGPVNGGLTDSNTLVGDLGNETVTTAGNTKTLGDNMHTLVFGLTAAVSAGINLVNSFLSIRDAGFRVEGANIRAERSTVMVDKAMLGLSKALQKLATDSEAPIQGIGRLQTAFATFHKLIVAGITSGPEYAAALNELKLAADGLEGSTVKDNHAIAAFQVQLDGAVPRINKMNLDSRKLNKAMEDQAKAFIETGLNVAAFAGGLGTTVSAIVSAGAAATTLKGALAAMGTTISASVLPVLTAIAVPVGIAIAAFAAFTAAVIAIRANIGIFDALGQKVGDVFPAMRGFLDDARQGFINLSDGLNTAISIALGAIDQLTGGVAGLQAQWDGFTNTLPKGTGELGLAGKAMQEWAIMTADASDQIRVGAGKWKEADGVLLRLNGSVLAAKDTWMQLGDGTAVYLKSAQEVPPVLDASTTAMDAFGATAQTTGHTIKEQSVNYSELTNAQRLNVQSMNDVIDALSNEKLERFNAIKAAENYLVAHGTTAAAVGLSGDVLIGYVNALRNEGPAYAASVQEASEYLATKHKEIDLRGKSNEWILKTAAAMEEEDKALGKVTETTAKHVEELTKLKQAHTDAAAEILFYSDATNMATRMQLEYQAGIDTANLKLIDQQAALANTAGELQRNFELLDAGTLQEIAFAEGVQEAAKMLQTKILALEKMKGAYEATNILIKEGTLLSVEFATGMQETQTAVQKSTLEVAKLAGELEGYNVAATKAEETNNALMKGFLEQKKALNDLVFEYAAAVGATEALRMELVNSEDATLRFNKGLAEGRKSALEFLVGLNEARGAAVGFRSELLAAAQAIPGAMADMSSKTTEELQQIIEVAAGVPGAFQEIVQSIDAMGQEIVNQLSKAGAEGKKNFMDNIDELEKELGVKFSEPLKRELLLQANVQDAQNTIEGLLGTLATTLRDKPLEIALETQAAQDAMSLLIAEVDKAAAMSPKFIPLQTALRNLAAWTPSDGLAQLPVLLTNVLQEAQGMEGGMQSAITAFDSMFSSAAQSAEGLAALKTAFESVGLSFDTVTGKVTDSTGKMVADLQVLGEGATTSAATTVTAIDTLGPAGTAARTTLAFELVALEFLMDRFAQEVKQSAIEVSTAFSNMGTNVTLSLNRLASGIIIVIASFTKIATGSQTMASTVSGSFSNMSTNAISSMNRMASGIIIILSSFTKISSEAARMNTAVSSAMSSMASRTSSFASTFSSAMSKVSSSAGSATSKVKALQSAINSLKSKSITITVTTVYRTIYAAKGGAFVSSSPTTIGPMKVSEFGQKELVTVTPLETPGGNTVKGISNMIQGADDKKRRRAMDEDKGAGAGRPSGRKEVVMMRELPIIIQVDGREITRVVNKRMFEESDALT